MRTPYIGHPTTGRQPRFRKIKLVPASEPLYAAQGDDDLMSQAPRKRPPGNPHKMSWKQNMSAAKAAWSKLNHDELMQSEGSEEKLICLIARRYNLSTNNAQQQVKRFFQQCTH